MIQEPPGGLPESMRGAYLAIDPGRDTGWALFVDRNSLIACGLGDPRTIRDIHLVRSVAIELPKIYNARNMKGDPNDIVKLAVGVGRYADRFECRGIPVALVTPHEWKGTTPKEIENARTLTALSARERDVVRRGVSAVAGSKHHNVVDAVGFGRACFEKRLWL